MPCMTTFENKTVFAKKPVFKTKIKTYWPILVHVELVDQKQGKYRNSALK